MVSECSTGELLTGAAFMHHYDKRYNVLKHYAALKGLKLQKPWLLDLPAKRSLALGLGHAEKPETVISQHPAW